MSGRISFGVRIASLLMATFFGGFLFLQAAPVEVSFTIGGESTREFPVGESSTFSVTFENSDEVTSEVIISILDESFIEVEGLESISCGSGEDYSLDFEIDCFWDPAFEGSESVSFDVVIEDAGEYTLFVTTYTDDPEDFGTEHEFSITAVEVEEENPFTLDGAATYDEDGNGFIDTIKPEFSTIPDKNTFAIEDITVDGYTVTAVGHWEFGLELDLDAIMITVEEGDAPDGGATPDVTIVDVDDRDGNTLDETTVTSTDMVLPIMIGAEISEDGTKISVTFSEDVDGTTVNGTGTDFYLSENTITAADEISPGVVDLTLASTTEATSIDVTLEVGAINPASIEDLAGNKAEEQTVSSTRAADETPVVISFVGLTTNASSTDAVMVGDEITLTFLLAEEAASVSVDLVDEIDVAVATTGTTYTATYTVDADTPSGTVTFSISVLDDSENESTATETTDESALVVYQEEEEVVVEGSSLEVSIPLTSVNGGLNLISLPIVPEDTSISSVLDEIIASVEAVWTYIDGTWYVYYPDNAVLSNLTSMEVGYAYFIEVSEDVTLTVLGDLWDASREISSGWQLVGYPQIDEETTDAVSIDTAFSSIGLAGVAYTDLVSYEDGEEVSVSDVSLGDGFWMNVASDVTLSRSI
ncbi:MAG: hypothetical protein ACJKSS_00420 [Patescibacteria group bacterium UBA2103]